MLLAATDSGLPAVIIVLGLLAGAVALYLFKVDRSEVGSKWLAASLGVTALGVLLGSLF